MLFQNVNIQIKPARDFILAFHVINSFMLRVCIIPYTFMKDKPVLPDLFWSFIFLSTNLTFKPLILFLLCRHRQLSNLVTKSHLSQEQFKLFYLNPIFKVTCIRYKFPLLPKTIKIKPQVLFQCMLMFSYNKELQIGFILYSKTPILFTSKKFK